MTWAATQAKAKFSEVLDRAEEDGPQHIRRRKQEFYLLTREQLEHPQVSAQKGTKNSQAGERPFVSAWDALAPSFDERYDVTFPRLKGKLRKVMLG